MNMNATKLDQFLLSGRLATINVVLLYGQDAGVMDSSYLALIKAAKRIYPNAEFAELDYASIKDSPKSLLDIMRDRSLFNEGKVLTIQGCGANFNKDLISVIQDKVSIALLILHAGDLPKTSMIRKAVESMDKGLGIGCYRLDLAAIKDMLALCVKKAGLTVESQVMDVLPRMMPGNPSIIAKEIEKLALFVAARNDNSVDFLHNPTSAANCVVTPVLRSSCTSSTLRSSVPCVPSTWLPEADFERSLVTLQDVYMLYQNNSEFSLDDLCAAIISKNQKNLIKVFSKIAEFEISFAAICRMLLSFFTKLLSIKRSMDKGVDAQQAVMQLQPPVFFRIRDNLMLAAKTWAADETQGYIEKILELERSCKTTGSMPELFVEQVLLDVS